MTAKRFLTWTVCLVLIMSCVAGASASGLELPLADFSGALHKPDASTVRADGYFEVSFSSPEAGGMDGVVETSDNLELVGFTSAGISAQLSADNHVVTIFGDPVTYVYKITGDAGQDVSVRLKDAECTDGKGGLFAMQDESFEAPVLPAGESGVPSSAMLEAASVMSGPEGSVAAGGTVDIVFVSPVGGGMDGVIRVSDNLTFESMRSEDLGVQLSAKDHVVSLFADPVTYTYRVNAAPGEEVSVRLVNGKTADEYRNLYTVPEQIWTGIVGQPAEPSAPAADDEPEPSAPAADDEPEPSAPAADDEPEPSAPAADDEPEPSAPAADDEPGENTDASFMLAPETAVEGRCIEVQFTSPDDGGMEGYIETSDNLAFQELRGGFLSTELSSERKAVSLFGEPLTYVYRVEAEAGEDISVSLARGQQSDGNCALSPVEPESWTCTVQPAVGEAPEEFVPVMDVPDEVVEGAVLDISFMSPVDGGMDGMVSTSSNLHFEGVVSAGNGARLSSDDKVRSLLGVPVTYRYRVTGDAGSPVYVRLTDGRTADAETNMSAKVRNQIWMGVVEEGSATNCAIEPAAGSGIRIAESRIPGIPGSFLTGAEGLASTADLLAQLSVPEGMELAVFNADGTPAEPGAEIATGQIVAANQNGAAAASAAVVVPGDVTGRGQPGISQVVRMAAACTSGKPLAGPYLLAGDLNANGSMDIGDLTLLVHRMQTRR